MNLCMEESQVRHQCGSGTCHVKGLDFIFYDRGKTIEGS